MRMILAPAAVVLLLAGCSSAQAPPADQSPTPIATETVLVGAYDVGESQILANLYAGALNAVGQPAAVRVLRSRRVLIPALEKGDIGAVGEYAATVTEFLNKQENGADAPALASADLDQTMSALRALAEPAGLVVLDPAEAADQGAFAVRQDFAEANALTTVSDLAEYSRTDPVVVGGPPECPQQPLCLMGLADTYGVQVGEFRTLDAGGPLTKGALAEGEVDVAPVLATDGELDQFGLVLLEDDLGIQPADNVVPVLNEDAATGLVTETLDRVQSQLTNEALRELNYSVDRRGEDPAAVADAWLTVNGLA